MSTLLVSGKHVGIAEYLLADEYRQDVLSRWHRNKPIILCACRPTGQQPVMHVKKTKHGKYTLSSNPAHANKHSAECRHLKAETISHAGNKRSARRVGDVLHFDGVRDLFADEVESVDQDLVKSSPEKNNVPVSVSVSGTRRLTRPEDVTLVDIVFEWSLLALEFIEKDGKVPAAWLLLYYLWVVMVNHQIIVNGEDFYHVGYIPNVKYFEPKQGKKVVLGWVSQIHKVDEGEMWGIKGLKKCETAVLVPNRHRPEGEVVKKLAVLRVVYQRQRPATVGRVYVFEVTKDGRLIHPESEHIVNLP